MFDVVPLAVEDSFKPDCPEMLFHVYSCVKFPLFMIFELVAAVIDDNAAAADIVMSPAPNKDVPFMVLMVVPLTKIG